MTALRIFLNRRFLPSKLTNVTLGDVLVGQLIFALIALSGIASMEYLKANLGQVDARLVALGALGGIAWISVAMGAVMGIAHLMHRAKNAPPEAP